jgi:tetratricopeptide (TPR) repeat protein
MLRGISCAAAVVLAFCIAGAAAAADDTATCQKAAGDDATIAACTRLLNRRDAVRDAIHTKRGDAYYNKGEYDRAIADYDQALRFNPNNANARNNRDVAQNRAVQPDVNTCQNGAGDDAIAACSRLLSLTWAGIHRDAVYRTRGNAHYRKTDYDRAIADYDASIGLAPKDAGTYSNRGAAYNEKGDMDRAIADFDQAIRLDPKLANAYSNRGYAYNKMGEYDRAIADLDQAIRLDPKLADAYNNRGDAYNKTGEYDRAIADLDQAIGLDPKLASAYSNRGESYNGKSEYDRAIADLDQAIRLDPKYAEAYSHLGFAYGQKGDFVRAMAELDKAIALNPGYAAGYGNRAAIYAVRGDNDHATADYQTALKLDPKLAGAANLRKVQSALAAVPVEPVEKPDKAVATVLSQQRVALVIGNSAYRAVPALPNPRRDAETVAAALRETGFQRVELAMDLDRDGMVKALRAFREQADRADWALIYFAGHGIEINRINYLIPVDATLADDRDVKAQTVSYEELLEAVDGAAMLRLVVLDACRDNPFKGRMHRTDASRGGLSRGLAPPPEMAPGTLVVYSAKEGETAADNADGANSPFARAFVAELKVPGLEVRRVFDNVRDDVIEATRRRQQPFTYGSLPGRRDFFFVAK